ncbi:hypothetical protein BU16DRAFT_200372 [Lophium mytilinum]|uniref:Uncharacterized protein n=1 Tax=Lophium mytilinum TaxID=390894 RepID=A0A6A6RCJ4_9PEZI|nr:hypothetical protein BU16DRAFT_200372 [Lophium mytilinum]
MTADLIRLANAPLIHQHMPIFTTALSDPLPVHTPSSNSSKIPSPFVYKRAFRPLRLIKRPAHLELAARVLHSLPSRLATFTHNRPQNHVGTKQAVWLRLPALSTRRTFARRHRIAVLLYSSPLFNLGNLEASTDRYLQLAQPRLHPFRLHRRPSSRPASVASYLLAHRVLHLHTYILPLNATR